MPLTTRPQSPAEASGQLWRAVLQALEGRVAKRHHDSLVSGLPYLEIGPGMIRIVVPTEQAREWLDEGTLMTLSETVTTISDGPCAVSVCPVDGRALELCLDPSHVLDVFLRSPANERAWKLVQRLAEGSVPVSTPVVLAGPEGTGKSHLLHGLAQALAARSQSVACESATSLSTRLIDSLCNDELTDFRDSVLACDALLIDAVDTLRGRDGTQDELARAIQTRAGRAKLVVLTTRASGDDLPALGPELRAAVARGTRVDLAVPEWELRVAILMERALRWGVSLSQDAASFVIGRLGSGVASLDSLLTRLLASLGDTAQVLDIDAVREALTLQTTSSRRPLPPASVMALVARHFGLRVRDLRSASRSPRVSTPRHIAMYLVREHCNLSFPEIGRRFARHHTTVIHGCRAAERRLEENGSAAAAIRLLEKEVEALREEVG
jgi:chromosomal replication initiator protein